MMVLVCLFNRTDSLSNNIIICDKSKEIICPKCKEICRIKFENYKIKLYDCINGNIIDNIKLTEFKNTQKVNVSEKYAINVIFKINEMHQIMDFIYVSLVMKTFVLHVKLYTIKIII